MNEGLNPEEQKAFDDGVLEAIDAGIETSGKTGSQLDAKPAEDTQDPAAPPIPEPEPKETAKPDPNEAGKSDSTPEPEPKVDEAGKKPEEIAAGEDPDGGAPVPSTEDTPAASDTKAEEKEARPSDKFGELEEDAKPATKERFETMKTSFDEQATELERVTGQNDAWMDTINRTGATPDQLGLSLQYLEDINTGTPESLSRAYSTMETELEVLGKALGKKTKGFNPLDAYPELKEKVKEGYLDEADALEIAQGRIQGDFSAVVNERATSVGVSQAAKDQGVRDLAALGTKLRANDSRYKEKIPFINSIVEAVVANGSDPATWAAAVEKAYNVMPELPKAGKEPLTPVPNTIRPGMAGKSDFNKEPSSAMEAMDISLSRGY